MEVDRRAFIASLGGVAAVNLMDHEAKRSARALHGGQAGRDGGGPGAAEIPDRCRNRSADRKRGRSAAARGGVFTGQRGENVKKPPAHAGEADVEGHFELRFAPANHVLQSATARHETGMSEEIILACCCTTASCR